LYLHAIHNALTGSITGHDVILHTIPLFHVNGWGVPHYLTGLGGQHVLLPRFDPGEVLRLVETHRITRLLLVPTMVQMLLDHPDLGRRDVSSVLQVTVGGAPPPPDMLAAVEAAFDAECVCGYGMTETSPSMLRSLDKPGLEPSAERRASTGLPIIGVDLRVFDDRGAEIVWDGQHVGEVCVRSNHVMIGYLGDVEATDRVVVDGWLHTGDLAVVRPDGFVQVVDRKKDLIVSGGENIACPEVEHALLDHPAVREASVVGTPDDRWGEVPRAFVSFRDDVVEPPTAADLIAFVRERLAHFKAPRDVIVLADLPKGGTGKIQKQTLRAWTP
jgi:fatty-acyl-CoA synthase